MMMVPLFQSQENIAGEVVYLDTLLVDLCLIMTEKIPLTPDKYTIFNMKVSIEPVLGKKVEHNGVKIELLGQIGIFPTSFLQYALNKNMPLVMET